MCEHVRCGRRLPLGAKMDASGSRRQDAGEPVRTVLERGSFAHAEGPCAAEAVEEADVGRACQWLEGAGSRTRGCQCVSCVGSPRRRLHGRTTQASADGVWRARAALDGRVSDPDEPGCVCVRVIDRRWHGRTRVIVETSDLGAA